MISQFRDEYAFLSNFHPCYIHYGLVYQNAEACFQAQKLPEEHQRHAFCFMTPKEAKAAGRKVTLRPDWESEKEKVMKSIIRAKFLQNPDLLQKLLATGKEELVEGNSWHDNTWGACTCNTCKSKEKRNLLGKALMEFRDMILDGEKSEFLCKPAAGWSTVCLNGKRIGGASYLDDVAGMTLDTLLQYLHPENTLPFGLNYDGESEGNFGISEIAGSGHVYHTEMDGYQITEIPNAYPMREWVKGLAKQVVSDVIRNIDDWAGFSVYDEDRKTIQKNKKELLNKCERVLQMIAS